MVFSVNPSLCTDVLPPSEKIRETRKREHDYRRRFTDLFSPDFSEGGGTSVHRVRKSWICGITSCMYASLICPGM